jgi:hypothetical protein
MKKHLAIFALAFLIAFPVFAVDTALEGLTLTEKQLTQSESLKSDVVKGFAVWRDKTVVVSTRELTGEELTALRSELAALPDEYTAEAIAARFTFKTLMGRLNQELPAASILRLAPYTGALESYIDWKNFSGIKAFLDGLPRSEL